jgi:hypothetical protein
MSDTQRGLVRVRSNRRVSDGAAAAHDWGAPMHPEDTMLSERIAAFRRLPCEEAPRMGIKGIAYGVALGLLCWLIIALLVLTVVA